MLDPRAHRVIVVWGCLLTSLLASCFSPLDLSGRRCPCDQGWTCVADRCVQGLDASADVSAPGDVGDASTGDAGAEACPLEAFCEDFESPSPEANGWTVFPDFSRVRFLNATSPDPSVVPHRGSGMLRVVSTTPGGQSDIVLCPFEGFTCPTEIGDAGTIPDAGVAALDGIVDGDVYLRAYLWAPSTLSDGSAFEMGHASVLYVGSHRGPWVAGEDVISFNLDVDHASMYVGTIGERIEPRPADGERDDRPPFARDTWICVRVHVHIDPVNGSVASYLGDDEIPEVERTGIDTLPRLPYLHFGVGLGYTSEMPNGAALYVDDVAFSRAPLSCID